MRRQGTRGEASTATTEASAQVAPAPVSALLADSATLRRSQADVGLARERSRRRRLGRLFLLLLIPAGYLALRIASGDPFDITNITLPSIDPMLLVPALFFIALLGVLLGTTVGAGRSPHVTYRPEQIDVSLDEVIGIDVVKDDVVRSLNLFLAHRTFAAEMGGTARRGLLFEGQPGTGKTYLAKAMAREAGVPFLFVSATSFQSMYYGATARKIRSYFKALRKAARQEGGAIGFIEEIDAIAGARSGMRRSGATVDAGSPGMGAHTIEVEPSGVTEGISGVVNELLIQLQSFDSPTVGQRLRGAFVGWFNLFLPANHQIKKAPPLPSNILVIGATNRAADLDPALLRPGRFDRSIHFDLPNRSGRREIIDYYLAKKAHVPELDKEERRDQLAAMTFGYTPVMIEHLLDESLVWSLRDGREAMDWRDVQSAKLTEEIGLKQPVEYSDGEKTTIATHEAGHAVIAYLVGQNRKLEVLSIIKRRDALGLLAHSDKEERYLRTRSELVGSIQIAFGGMTAEELFFGEAGTGPSGDLAHATRVAAQMVGSFGMAGSLISLEAVEPGPITQGIVAKVLANEDARSMVERILDQAKMDVRSLLDGNRHLVAALRDELLEREELVGDEIVDVLHEAEQRHALGLG